MRLFESIQYMIDNRLHMGKNYFHWSLPRQVGVTTWFIAQIEQDLRNGLTVVYAACDRQNCQVLLDDEYLHSCYKNKQLILSSNVNAIRGKSIDRLYADNTKYWKYDQQIDLMFAAIPALTKSGGYAVFIDTTEG